MDAVRATKISMSAESNSAETQSCLSCAKSTSFKTQRKTTSFMAIIIIIISIIIIIIIITSIIIIIIIITIIAVGTQLPRASFAIGNAKFKKKK